MVLEEPEAVRMDGADEHRAEPVEEVLALCLKHPFGDAILKGSRRSLRESERDNLGWFRGLCDEGRDSP
jgi:hypothetical protein